MGKNRTVFLCLWLGALYVNDLPGEEAKKISCLGKVVTDTGKPVSGVKVTFYKVGVETGTNSRHIIEKRQVITGAHGKFSFKTTQALYPGRGVRQMAMIVAEKKGLALEWENWHLREDLETVIKMGEAKVLAGKVVDEADNPVAGAEVRISMLSAAYAERYRYLMGTEPLDFLVTRTDEQGSFSFNNISEKATGEFLVKKPGRAILSTFEPGRYDGTSLQFAAGQADIKLVQAIEAKVEGMVVEKDSSKPVGGVRLMMMRNLNRPGLEREAIVSKDDGTFHIDALSAGKYFLRIILPSDKPAEWVAEPVEVTVEKGKTKTGVKVEVSKGGVLEVVVKDSDSDKAVENAWVSVRHRESQQWFNGRSDKKGVARIRLLPGEYVLERAYKEGYTAERREETVRIEQDKTVRVEMELASAPKVTGVVRDGKGKPVEGATIKICPMGQREIKTDDEGKFEASWDPRRWGPEGTTAVYLVARHRGKNLAAAMEIDEDTRTLDIRLAPGVIFKGKVLDPDNKGISGAKVNLMMRAANWGSPISSWERGGTRTDAKGAYEITAIPAGQRYIVRAGADRYGRAQAEVHTDDAADNRLAVEALTLAVANLSVSGVVVDVNDKLVSGAMIHCYGQAQPDRNTQTDEQGNFTIDNICEGRIGVSAATRGMTGSRAVRLHGYVETEGGATDVRIVLTESRSSGRRYVPRQPPSLAGKSLPELEDFGVELPAVDANDKMILVCFWDMNQRPSRHMVRELVKRAEQLKEKGVIIALVQASKVDENALNKWVEKYNIGFPVGMVKADEEKTRFAWGVRALPWLILTDRQHIVRADGFSPTELDEKTGLLKTGKQRY